MDRIVKQIENGPGELDIVIDVFRQISHHHPDFTFSGVKMPVSISAISRSGAPDVIKIIGVVMLNDRNRHRYHDFTARYNTRTRSGEAEFETTCRKCGSEVNEYGLCISCDPCPRCDRKECQPHFSCTKAD